MRLLFSLTYYYPHWTGLTQYARRLAEGLAKRGHKVKVLTTKHEDRLKDKEMINEVEVIRKPILYRLSRTLISPELIFSFWRQIRSCDRVVIYLPFAEVLIATLIAKILNKRVYLVHNGDLVLPKGIFNRFIEKFYFLTTSIAIFFSDGVIIQTVDYAKRSLLLSKFKKKWQVILPLFEKRKENKKTVKKLGLKLKSDRKFIVGFAGRFTEEKGFDILNSAILLVEKKLPGTHFVFAGETNIAYENFFEKNKDLIEKNKKYLSFLGRLKEKEMASFYKLCNIFVISSRTDCFPSVEAEALLTGVPVVVTDIPGASWLVKITGMGMIVKRENPQALADGISEVIKNRQRYIKPHRTIQSIFDYQKTLSQYEKLIIGEYDKQSSN